MNNPSEFHPPDSPVALAMNVEGPRSAPSSRPDRWQRWTRDRWALMPFALLGGLGAGLAVIIRIAVVDPSFAVEPEYYQHALKWDEERARQERSANLGWTVAWDFATGTERGPAPALTGPQSIARPLTLQLRDAQGQPITAARVELSMFHKARAVNVQRSTPLEQDSGTYAAQLLFERSGIWRVRVDVFARNEHFALVQDVELTHDAGRVLEPSGGDR